MNGLAYDILKTGIALAIIFLPFLGLLRPFPRSWKTEPPYLLEVEITPAFENDWRRLLQLLGPLARETGVRIEEREQKIFLLALAEPQVEAIAATLKNEHGMDFSLGEPDIFYRYVRWTGGMWLWEPVMRVKVFTPDTLAERIGRDLRNRRGRVASTVRHERGKFLLTAVVPLENMLGYTTALASLSGGDASYTIIFDHFSRLPPEDDPPKQPAMIMR